MFIKDTPAIRWRKFLDTYVEKKPEEKPVIRVDHTALPGGGLNFNETQEHIHKEANKK